MGESLPVVLMDCESRASLLNRILCFSVADRGQGIDCVGIWEDGFAEELDGAPCP